ncbi:MAG: PaaI family thioesterase [Pseudomonadota bacterium]
MTNQDVLDFLNGQWPPSVTTLNGVGTGFDIDTLTLEMAFSTDLRFCHSGDIVQGGYITAMLDAAMAYAIIGIPDICYGVATLEIKSNFLNVARNGQFTGIGTAVHVGRSIAYLEGKLLQNDSVVATATSTVKLLSRKT